MKQLALLAFLLLATIGNTQSLISEDKMWVTREGSFFPNTPQFQYYKLFEGTTEIDGKTYHRLLRGVDLDSLSYYLAFRETADKKVYLHTGSQEFLLYDFGASVGDTLDILYRDVVVTEVDTILLENGEERRRLTLEYENAWSPGIWIEGIGSIGGPLSLSGPFEILDNFDYLNCCMSNDELLWHNPDENFNLCSEFILGTDAEEVAENELQIFTHQGVLHLKGTATKNLNIQLFNSQGQLVQGSRFEHLHIDLNSELRSGIYFYMLSNSNELIQSGKIFIP